MAALVVRITEHGLEFRDFSGWTVVRDYAAIWDDDAAAYREATRERWGPAWAVESHLVVPDVNREWIILGFPHSALAVDRGD